MSATRVGAGRQKTNQDRWGVLNAFVDGGITAAGLSPASCVVWLVLYREGRWDAALRATTTEASVKNVTAKSGLCEKTVKRSLRELRDANMLRTIRKGGLGRGPNRYLLAAVPINVGK